VVLFLPARAIDDGPQDVAAIEAEAESERVALVVS
jgi:hypothetical protein